MIGNKNGGNPRQPISSSNLPKGTFDTTCDRCRQTGLDTYHQWAGRLYCSTCMNLEKKAITITIIIILFITIFFYLILFFTID